MQVGICLASKIDNIDYVVEAERLGFTRAWFGDSQMIWSDVYACMALAAARTSTIGLGTGVAVAGTRVAPVTAASIATINRLAPGRTYLGIGNGNTGWRLMGHKPVPPSAFDEYVRIVRALLDGEDTDFTDRGVTARIGFDVADRGFIDVEHRVPIYVSAFGPKAQAIAGRYGNGVMAGLTPNPSYWNSVWTNVETAATAIGRPLERADFFTAALSAACVLRAGEDLTSDRVIETVGAYVMMLFHFAYDNVRAFGGDPPAMLDDDWEQYCAMLEAVPEGRRHRRTHVGHAMWLEPEERKFVTPKRIRATCLVGSGREIVEQLDAFDRAGLHHLMLVPSLAKEYEALEDVSRHVLSKN